MASVTSVRKLIELDLALPTTEEWLERIRQRDPVTGLGVPLIVV
jgi:hypothetical protein